MAREDTKIAIVGAGRVGSTFAYALAASRLAREIVLVDADRGRAEGEAMDIEHAVPFHAPVEVRPGDLGDAAGAAVTVITAGAAQRQGESRPALVRRNVDMLRSVVGEVARVNPDGLVVVTSNPVDALTFAALQFTGLPASQVFGSGTVLDTARLRAELAKRYGVDARNVHGYVLGEHGDSELVAWSSASIASVNLADYCREAGLSCTADDREAISLRVRRAAEEIIRRKGATNFAIAAALTRIVEAVLRDEASVLTVSTRIDGLYGIEGVCLSLPAIVDAGGVRRVLPMALSDSEVAELRRSAEAIRATIVDAGLRPAHRVDGP